MSSGAARFAVGKCFGAPGDVILKGFLMVSQLEHACWALKLYAQSCPFSLLSKQHFWTNTHTQCTLIGSPVGLSSFTQCNNLLSALPNCVFLCSEPAVRRAGELLHGWGAGLQQVGRNHKSQRENPDRQGVQRLLSRQPVPRVHHVSPCFYLNRYKPMWPLVTSSFFYQGRWSWSKLCRSQCGCSVWPHVESSQWPSSYWQVGCGLSHDRPDKLNSIVM